MPSTFSPNNGLELIADGEQSGTWGGTTNDNLSFIDTSLDGQVTVTLPATGSSGAPNSLAISNGVASDGRNRQITFEDAGDLGATAFVQLTPNDAEKIFIITNSLSADRSVILFQGTYSASNDLELANGQTAMVKFDGAGAGAVVTRLISDVGTPDNVAITGGSITGATITGGTITGITDLAVTDGGTGASTASGARTNLGLAIGTDVQAFSSVLAATTASYTTAEETKLSGIEAGADVTDTASVTAAGALMDSEVDADIKTLSLPANTTISTFGASLVDDAAASNARTTLGLVIGTDVQAWNATLDGIDSALAAKAPLASPALTGTPTAPTATAGTDTTQIATTAFVQAASGISGSGSIATTSGTSAPFTGIPAGVSEINIHFDGVRHTAIGSLELVVGTSGGLVTSGYASTLAVITNNATDEDTQGFTASFLVSQVTSNVFTISGTITLKRAGPSLNLWTQSGALQRDVNFMPSAGSVTLAGELTQLAVRARVLAGDFDAGQIYVSWRY